MDRKKPLRRKSGLNRRNESRRKRLFKKQFGSEERLEWLKSHRCICGSESQHAHHVVSRGAGGKADDMVPLCAVCHNEIHQHGQRTYELKNGVDLPYLARLYAERWEERDE